MINTVRTSQKPAARKGLHGREYFEWLFTLNPFSLEKTLALSTLCSLEQHRTFQELLTSKSTTTQPEYALLARAICVSINPIKQHLSSSWKIPIIRIRKELAAFYRVQ